jgi:hypothetical protein
MHFNDHIDEAGDIVFRHVSPKFARAAEVAQTVRGEQLKALLSLASLIALHFCAFVRLVGGSQGLHKRCSSGRYCGPFSPDIME